MPTRCSLGCVRSPATNIPSQDHDGLRSSGMVFSVMSKPQGQKGIFLRASRDIESIKRQGQRISTTLFNLLAHRIDNAPSQVGIVVSKRFGNAVRRNRAKRVFRVLVRQTYQDLLPGLALLVFPKREALAQTFDQLKRVWETSLKRAHLFRPRTD